MTTRRPRRPAGAPSRRLGERGARAPAGRAAALFAQGLARFQAGQNSEAADLFGQALAADPGHIDSLHHLGIVAHRAGHADLARGFFVRALAIKPDFAAAHYNLGLALRALGALDASAAALQQAVAHDPELGEALVALAAVRHAQGRLEDATVALKDAIARRPAYAEAHMNLGNVLRELGRLTEASAHSRKAVALAPQAAIAYRNAAVIARDQGLVKAAVAAFDRTLALDPDFEGAQSARLFCLNYDPDVSAAALAQEHRLWGERIARRIPASEGFHAGARDGERRLRIGYVSGDFHDHPVGYFLSGVLEAHDKAAVEVIAYANDPVQDRTTARLRAAADGWRSLHGLSDAACEAQIRADGVDILVDLSGHVAANRLALFARRCAPVQASWLGYVATTGLGAMDYLITDADTVPAGADNLWAEALVRLPHGRFCYAPPAYAPPVAPPPSSRGQPFTFGSFNDLLKIGPDVIRLWSRVLRAAPGSRLLLKWMALGDAGVRARLSAAFATEGVEAERLVFSAYAPHAQMLAEYAAVDVALDPFPFCGGLTTCEALWMGVPVVTLPGERAASRQSLAFLNRVGLSELAAGSDDAYVAIAAALAADPARLAALRKRLRSRMAASPLCRAELFTPTLEAAFRGMWRRWCAGQPPAAFEIEAPRRPHGLTSTPPGTS